MADERRKYEEDCCGEFVPLKPNCEEDCCSRLKVECDSIANAECVPILSERIFDCVCLESMQCTEGNLDFTIETMNAAAYEDGASICIDKVGLCYDFIGAVDTELTGVRVDGDNNYVFQPPIGSGYTGCADPHCHEEEDGTLYDEYVAIVANQKCGTCKSKKEGTKVRIFASGIALYVCNAKITVMGRIGCKPFKAFFELPASPGHPFEITSIPGLNPLSICGKLCVPMNKGRSTVYMEFKPCVSIECIQANHPYMAPQNPDDEATFNATVEGTLLINTILTSTVTEKMAVFTTRKGIECNNGNKAMGCKSECDKKGR